MATRAAKRKIVKTLARKKIARPPRKKVSAIPPGVRSVTPHLAVRDAAAAIEFYVRAFGAKERFRMAAPNGSIVHAELAIGDSQVYLAEEFPGGDVAAPASVGGTTTTIHLAVRNVDRAYERALAAGATVTMPLANMFWGDRFAKVRDPFGHSWSLSQHVEDVPPKKLAKRAAAMFPAA